MYGLLDIINRIISFSKYGNLGFISVVVREYNYEVQKDPDKAEYIKNVAYSSEFILAIFVSALIFSISFLYIEDKIIFIGIISASFMFLISKLRKIFFTHLRVHKEFARFARFNTLNGLIVSISVISSISYIGIYAPLIVAVISSGVVFYIMYKKIDLNLTFLLKKDEVLRQLKVGISLGGLTFLYGLGIYIERYFIVDKFGLEGVGFFAFAIFFVMLFQYFIYDIVRPYMPVVKAELANNNFDILKMSVVHPTLKLMPLVIVAVLIIHTIVPVLVNIYLPEYIQAIEIFKITIWLLIPVSLSAFSGYLLYSQGIDKTHYAYASHLIYIAGISFFFFIIGIESIIDLVKIFLIFGLAKSLFQAYHVLNILYSRFLLITIAFLIEAGFLWFLQ
jgi:O-antigen/teichoic acid export membrane protein